MELNDIQLCYFAALIEGLRVIEAKAIDQGVVLRNRDIDGGALAEYVQVKGDRLVALHLGLRDNPNAIQHMKDVWPKPDPSNAIAPIIRKVEPGPEQVKRVCELLGQGTKLNKIETLSGVSQYYIKRIRSLMFNGAAAGRAGAGVLNHDMNMATNHTQAIAQI